MRKLASLAVACLGWCGAVIGADESLWPLPGQPPVRTFLASDFGGEPQVFSVVVSPSGLLYAANIVGVLEFDGARWRAISATGDLPLYRLQFDRNGVLWGGGLGRLGRLVPDDLGRWQLEEVLLPEGAVGRFSQSLDLGEDGIVFCSGGSAVRVRLDGSIELAARGRDLRLVAWAGSTALLFEGSECLTQLGRGCPPPWTKGAGPALPGLQAAVALEDDLMLVSHADGLQLYRGFAPVSPPVHPPELESGDLVQQFVRGPQSLIAAATLRSGTLLLDARGTVLRRLTRSGAGVLDDSCRGLAFDQQGGLWLGSDGGLNRVQFVSDLAVVPLNDLPTRLYRGAITRGENLWLGSSTGVVARHPDGRLVRLPGSPASVSGLFETPTELMVSCVGTNGGLWIVPHGSEQFNRIAGPPMQFGVQAPVLSPNRTWAAVAHTGGIVMYRRQGTDWRWAGAEFDTALPGSTARVVLTDEWMWFESGRRGVGRRRFDEARGPEGPIEKLGVAEGVEPFDPPQVPGLVRWEGECHLAASDRLLRWDPTLGRFVTPPELQGRSLQLSVAVSAVVGTDGALYLVQGRTVRAGREQRLYRLARSAAGDLELREYDLRASGIEVFGAHPEIAGGVVRLQGFGGMLLQRLAPSVPAPAPPQAAVRRVLANGQERWVQREANDGALELPYDERRELRIEYAAAWFAADLRGSPPLRYRTRLRGFDENWTAGDATSHRQFTSLPSGGYVFEVQALGWPGDPPGPVAALPVTIVAPWWMTPTARAVYLAGGALVCGFAAHRLTRAVFRRRLARAEAGREIVAERLRIARDMHDELGSTIGRVSFLSREGRQLPPEALVGRLEQIEALAREMNEAAGGIIWAVNPAHDTLNSFADRVSTYFCSSLDAAGVTPRLEIPPELPDLPFPSAARHQLLLAVKECVHNLVRHARARHGTLRLGCERGEVWLEIGDDGIGCEASGAGASKKGYGIESVAHRVQRLGGRFELRSLPGEGTTIRIEGIRLPDEAA